VKRVRGKNIIWISLLAILLSSPIIVNFSFAQTTPTMSVSPTTTQTNPTAIFMVSIDIADAVHVAGFEFKVAWDLALTEFPPQAGAGYFLQDVGEVYTYSSANILFKYLLVGGFLKTYGWADGGGTLATVTFQVKATESGSSPIHLYDTKLFDENGVPIPQYNVVDGSFYTTKPKPVFSWTPAAPIPAEVVTFDGTASYDPDGGSIVAWEWNFGDGSPHAFGAVVTHTYASYNIVPYQVTLTVTDSDQGDSWFVTKPLQIWRDLGIVSVWPSLTEADTTDYDGYATTLDYYEDPGYGLLSVIVTVVNFGTLKESYSLSVIIEGTDYNGVTHIWEIAPTAIWFMGTEYPTTIKAGAGSGWANWMLFDISYDAQTSLGLLGEQINTPVPPGQYTITATLTSAFDQDPSNNVMSAPFGVHGSVEVTNIVRGALNDRVFKRKHMGPITFGGFIKNFDNTIGVFRDPITEQGEYGRIVFDIMDESGTLVTEIATPAVYLNYLESSPSQLKAVWADYTPGKYFVDAYCQFGTSDGYFPYFGYTHTTFSFTVLP
jgi:hypothetical protein